ncbi:hypothetical protein AOC36_11250 [Erysipelothrix larvae]|uniref:DUF1934 domain-containing protein n=1 Tax=Erysipelothrix larvae TaxID=1514105 RepID=A0A0X8H1V4_9FIRM|nr:DUF1934 family protein [Erysipelothrix larvae]AMC94526.1 hypothetical protein AOC36_11250 [Erysipelothrix larvae]
MTINRAIRVQQHSNDTTLSFVDALGEVNNLNGSVRVIYRENDTVQVVLDITRDTCLLRRYGEWITTCYFSKEESWVQINSDEGKLVFEVQLIKLEVQDDFVGLSYNLIDNNQIIDSYNYSCSWLEEVKTWQEIH